MTLTWMSPNPEPGPITADSATALRLPTWWMRREFSLPRHPGPVTAQIVCLGYHELYLNGRRVGDEPLAPSLTRLDRRAFRIEHDISAALVAGENCLALWCSSGWYLPHQFTVDEGLTPLVSVRLCDAGGQPLLDSDTRWLCRAANRSIIGDGERGVWAWDYFGGEEILADADLPGWNEVGAATDNWHPARLVAPPPIEVTERTCPPNRIGAAYPARAVRRLDDGCFEVDFGTCLAGWVRITFQDLKLGQTVTLRFHDLPADFQLTDRPDQEGLDHSYHQVSRYRAAGRPGEQFTGKFNYAGFRYLTLEGLRRPPALHDMQAQLIETAMDRAGDFRCSNELFNRIHDLNAHTLRCLNLGGYSVDCPHRERQGYGADGQAVVPACLYLFDAASFLRKWLTDWCDVQDPATGRIPHCAPTRHHQDSPAWGGIIGPLAWMLWVHHRDRGALEAVFPVLRRYLDYLMVAVRDDILRRDGRDWLFLGDWVAPGRGMDSDDGAGGTREPDTPMRELVNTAVLIDLWRYHGRIAGVLGDTAAQQEARRQVTRFRRALHTTFYNADAGHYLLPEQTYQVLPLAVGAVPPDLRDQVHQRLLHMITVERDGHLDTGMTGTTCLIDYLTRHGCHDTLAAIYSQETHPGWGHMLAEGATAIWEQWNGYWSRIHSTFAGAASWFYAGLAGILPDEANPGFDHFHLKPAFLPQLDFVDCHHQCRHGRIQSAWTRTGQTIRWRVTIPPGSTATLHLPHTSLTREAGDHELVFDCPPSTP